MPKFLDLECSNCGATVDDLFMMKVPPRLIHWECGGTFEQVYRVRPKANAQLSDRDAVVVFRDANGKIRYPGKNTVPTPPGYERITMRSLHEVEKFCKEHSVLHEASHFDRGTARGFDDMYRGEKL